MPDIPLIVPMGYEAVEIDGRMVVQKRDDAILSKTIAFRLTTSEYNELLPFKEAFRSAGWAESFRWLLTQPEVIAVVDRRVRSQMQAAKP